MTTFFEWIVRRRWAVLFGGALVVAGGFVAWTRLPIDAFPDVTNIQVMVLTQGRRPVGDRRRAARHLPHRAADGRAAARSTQVRSISRAGLSQVVIVFERRGRPLLRAPGRVRAPPGRARAPAAGHRARAGAAVAPGSARSSSTRSRARASRRWRSARSRPGSIAPRLRTVPGVTEVNSFGGEVKQYQVVVHPERLLKYGLTLREVIEALERSNANAGAGLIVKGWEQMYIRGVGLFATVADIESVVAQGVGRHAGVRPRRRRRRDRAAGPAGRGHPRRRAARPSPAWRSCCAARTPRPSSAAVKDAVARIQQRLPEGLRIDVFYDRTALIEACIKTVARRAARRAASSSSSCSSSSSPSSAPRMIVVLSLPITFLFTFIAHGRGRAVRPTS